MISRWTRGLMWKMKKIHKHIKPLFLKQKQYSDCQNYSLDSACLTDIGGRKNNEDSVKILTETSSSTCLAIVADGMGGHAKGEIASQMAVNVFCMNYINIQNQPHDVADALRTSTGEFKK